METTVSYGIGVKNRYSAFLEEDDSFSSTLRATIVKQQQHLNPSLESASKQKNSTNHQSSKINPISVVQSKNQASTNVASNRLVNSSSANYKSDFSHQQKNSINGQSSGESAATANSQKRPQEGRRQRVNQQQHLTNNNNNSSLPTKQANSNYKQASIHNQVSPPQQGTKSMKTYSSPALGNHHNNHQSQHLINPATNNQRQQANSQHQHSNKENNSEATDQLHGRFQRNFNNNQRFSNTQRRPFLNSERKVAFDSETNDSSPSLGVAPNDSCVQSIEEGKRRRQQKRILDLKHKDPEKREARRQQAQNVEQANEAQTEKSQIEEGRSRGFRGNRRQFSGNGEGSGPATTRTFKGFSGGARGRGRPSETPATTEGTANENGSQAVRRNLGEKPQRNRNGMLGSRGGRGFRGDEQYKFGGNSEKPIPNFSDKLDFPSLMA